MRTQTKRTKSSRRSADRRAADHRKTLARLRSVVADVDTAEQDGLLYCGTIRLSGRHSLWVQVMPGVMALWWPYAESPHVVLYRDVPCSLPVTILDWSDDGFALVGYGGEPSQVAAWLDEVFRRVYHCKVGYLIKTELSDLSSMDA